LNSFFLGPFLLLKLGGFFRNEIALGWAVPRLGSKRWGESEQLVNKTGEFLPLPVDRDAFMASAVVMASVVPWNAG
jgi:hypothetical protein